MHACLDCPTLVRGRSRCEPCQARADAKREARQQQNQEKRFWSSWYSRSDWRRIRKAFLSANPSCVRCGNPATVVDHVVSHQGNLALFLDWNNLQAMCRTCHDQITAKYDGGFSNPRRPKPTFKRK